VPKLILANVDGLAMSGSPRNEEDYRHSAMAAERLLAMVTEEDLIVLPQQPSAEFLGYVNGLLGRNISDKQIVVPARGRSEGLIWSHEALNDGDVQRQVERRVGSVRGWDLVAFFLDRPAVTLADALRLRLPATAGFLRSGGAESLNSKVVFREIAAASGAPLAPGRVATGVTELAAALTELLPVTGHVIVKQDINLGGVGNTVVTRTAGDHFPGSRNTVRVGGEAELPAVADRLWPVVAAGRNTRAVVEAYFADARPLCCEFFVPGPGRAPELLTFGEMRMAPVFVGLELHGGTVSDVDSAAMVAHCVQIARAAGERGFYGHLNVDSLLTADGDILLSELNGRMGGCTHIDVLCRALLGPRYARTHALVTRNRVPVPSFSAAVRSLADCGLLFDHERAEGVFFAAEGVATTGTVEYIAAARTLDAARRMAGAADAALAAGN
jgi:hypothetical protein